MKRKMLLLTLALPVILCQNVQAQTSSRLVAQAHLVNNGASFTPTDSTAYSYSGMRGGDINHTMKYDNSTRWDFLGDTAYNNAWNYVQTFDANNNILTSISQYWSGTGWVLSTKNLYFYDSTNKMTAMIQQSWGGSSWVPVSQNVYTYIGSKLVVDQFQLWNNLTTSFQNSTQKNYYYDPISGNKINVTNIAFLSGVPVNQDEYTYSYTGSNQLYQTTYSTWNGASWDPNNMYTNTYDTTGNMINTLYQVYNPTGSSWVNQNLHVYSGFTSAHSPTQDIVQTWDTAGGGTWDNQIEYTYAYNAYNQITSSIGQSWNIVGAFEFALNDPMANYYYETYTSANVGVKNQVTEGNTANIFPVPAQNMLHIDLNWKDAQGATIAIYDMSGRVVSQWETPVGTTYASSISVSDLASGNYFVKINGAKDQIVKEFVVMH